MAQPSNSSHSGSQTSDEEGEWFDIDPEEEEPLSIVSLFDDSVFSDAKSMLEHCKVKHDFDFEATCQRLGLDFHGAVKLINWIRSRTRNGKPVPETVSLEDIKDDHFLKPVLEDDALIFCLDELLPLDDRAAQPPTAIRQESEVAPSPRACIAALEDELAKVVAQFEKYRLAVQETLDQRWGPDTPQSSLPRPSSHSGALSSKASNSSYYFEGYAGNEIHETMLKDTVRTDAYRDFIYNNKHLFKDKVVLDIGCGTGILSMFCAKAGAKRVLAVDNSDIINRARENVFHNGLADTISCIHGMIEEVKLPVDHVDIIVSEWMGYCLLYEAMLPSILWARDKYLAPDGLLVPSVTTLWLAPVADADFVADQVVFWRDVYGFDMRAMQAGIYDDARIEIMPAAAVCGTPFPFLQLPLHSVKVEDLTFRMPWKTELSQDIDSLDGFLIWFDTYFTTSPQEAVPVADTAESWASQKVDRVAFTTGPFGKATHWKQGLLLTNQDSSHSEEPPMKLENGCELSGDVSYVPPEDNPRALNIEITWIGPATASGKQTWKLQ